MPAINLNNTFGAFLIGVVVSAVLFGVTCIQTWYYFQNYSDNILVKATVTLLLVFEALHSVFSIHAIYYFVILNYLNPVALLKATWSATLTLAVSSVIMLIVHLFYTRRVYHMSRKNIPLTVLIILLALAHFATGISVTVRAFQLKYWAEFATIVNIVDASLSLAVAIDVLIAASLSYYLHTSRSGIRSTDTLINRLMVYAINNGILTSVFDIITLVFVTIEVDNLIFLSVFQVVGNLYTNSMLATLNSRRPTSGLATSTTTDASHGISSMFGTQTRPTTLSAQLSGRTDHVSKTQIVNIHEDEGTSDVDQSMEMKINPAV